MNCRFSGLSGRPASVFAALGFRPALVLRVVVLPLAVDLLLLAPDLEPVAEDFADLLVLGRYLPAAVVPAALLSASAVEATDRDLVFLVLAADLLLLALAFTPLLGFFSIAGGKT